MPRSDTAPDGLGIWAWASNDEGSEPDVVMACAGDVPTLETLAAVELLRQLIPDLRIRVINVVDLMTLQPQKEHPHGLSDEPSITDGVWAFPLLLSVPLGCLCGTSSRWPRKTPQRRGISPVEKMSIANSAVQTPGRAGMNDALFTNTPRQEAMKMRKIVLGRAFRQTGRDGIPQMAQIISQPSITEKLKGRYIDAIEEVLRANPGIELTQLRPMAEQAWVSALDILIQSERMAQRVTQQRQDEKRANRS